MCYICTIYYVTNVIYSNAHPRDVLKSKNITLHGNLVITVM